MNVSEFRQLHDVYRDPFAFLLRLQTLDPVLGIAPFPNWPHLRKLADGLLGGKRVLVVKSRQMMATVLMISDGLFMVGELIASSGFAYDLP